MTNKYRTGTQLTQTTMRYHFLPVQLFIKKIVNAIEDAQKRKLCVLLIGI